MKTTQKPRRLGMKYPKGTNNLIVLTIIAGLAACFAFTKEPKFDLKNLYGTWQYTRVERNGISVFEVGNSDTMNVNSNASFNYTIQKPGKKASGNWALISVPKDSSTFRKALVFTYEPKGKKRIFNICSLDKKNLCLREGSLKFVYKRR